jgi:hypothetical protein
MLGKFIAGDYIAIADEMHLFPASNENTGYIQRIDGFNIYGYLLSSLVFVSDVTGRINPRMDYVFCLLHIEEF